MLARLSPNRAPLAERGNKVADPAMCQTKKQHSAPVIVIVSTMSKLAARENAIAPKLER
jgi:hypothetical protein